MLQTTKYHLQMRNAALHSHSLWKRNRLGSTLLLKSRPVVKLPPCNMRYVLFFFFFPCLVQPFEVTCKWEQSGMFLSHELRRGWQTKDNTETSVTEASILPPPLWSKVSIRVMLLCRLQLRLITRKCGEGGSGQGHGRGERNRDPPPPKTATSGQKDRREMSTRQSLSLGLQNGHRLVTCFREQTVNVDLTVQTKRGNLCLDCVLVCVCADAEVSQRG